MAFSFGYNYFVDIPNQGDIMEGTFRSNLPKKSLKHRL